MPPINPNVQMSMFTITTSQPKESDRKSYEARAEVLENKIKTKTATADEVAEYRDIKARLSSLDRDSIFNQLDKGDENNVKTKKNVNNAFGQVRQFLSGFSDLFTPKTSDNTGEKEGEGIDE